MQYNKYTKLLLLSIFANHYIYCAADDYNPQEQIESNDTIDTIKKYLEIVAQKNDDEPEFVEEVLFCKGHYTRIENLILYCKNKNIVIKAEDISDNGEIAIDLKIKTIEELKDFLDSGFCQSEKKYEVQLSLYEKKH